VSALRLAEPTAFFTLFIRKIAYYFQAAGIIKGAEHEQEV
jgi:hypothetical protein